MNHKQKIVAIFVGVVFLGMLLYPPFHFIAERATINRGYSFILDPPQSGMATINTIQLLLQMFVIGAVGGIAWYLFKDRS